MLRITTLLMALLLLVAACAGDEAEDTGSASASGVAEETEAAEGEAASGDASVSFASLEDGAEVTSPLSVEFVAEGFEVQEAGEVNEGAGHMHVMVDVGCVEVGEVIPADDSHIHYGDGSTTAEIELEPGEHTLCLQAGDGAHTALDLTDEVTVTVTE